MYRDSATDSLVYSAEDLLLFRESPFASWMERLTLENPDHGIAPDEACPAWGEPPRPQQSFASALRAVGREFVRIPWQDSESSRQEQTLAAMRRGCDFILDGLLAVGPLVASANLLIRSSGLSELGDYLYLPCDSQGQDTPHTAFRLACLADLLHSLQGRLPAELLLIQRGQELRKLETEQHIHYYRALKQRFMLAQRHFKKHRMPDPVESAHFGRWTQCANDVIKRRWLAREELARDENSVSEDSVQEAEGVIPVRDEEAPRTASYAQEVDNIAAGQEFFQALSAAASSAGPPPYLDTETSVAHFAAEPATAELRGSDLPGEAFSGGAAPQVLQAASGSAAISTGAALSGRASEALDPVLRLDEQDFTAPYIDSDRVGSHPLDSQGFNVSLYRKTSAEPGPAEPGLAEPGRPTSTQTEMAPDNYSNRSDGDVYDRD